MTSGDEAALRHARHDLGDVTLHVVEAGPADGPAVILLHGFPDFWWGWRHQIGALAEAGFRVVAPDQRGYNTSGKPAGIEAYKASTLASDVVTLADALAIERFGLVGHDWGGVVAFTAAALHPQRVERLVVLNAPHPDTSAAYARSHPSQLFKSLYVGLFQMPLLPEALLRADGFRAMRRALTGSSRPGTFTTPDLDRYAEAWAQPGALSAMLNWYRALRLGHRPLPRIDAETLVLWGTEDRFLDRGLAEAARERCRSARVDYRNASHWLQAEDAAAVNAALIGFFGGVETRRG